MSKTIHCTNPNCGALIEIPENATQIICPDCNLWHFPNAYDVGPNAGLDNNPGDYGIPAVSEYQETSADNNFGPPADAYQPPEHNAAQQDPYSAPPAEPSPVPPSEPPVEAPYNPYAPPASDYQAPPQQNQEPNDPYQPPKQDQYAPPAEDRYRAPDARDRYDAPENRNEYAPPTQDQSPSDYGKKPPLVTEYEEAGGNDETHRNDANVHKEPEKISFGFLVTETGERLILKEGENIIGRKNTDLVIDDRTVSRKHCVIEVIVSDSGTVEHMIYDIGHSEGSSSTNGVFISGRSLRLQDYERIQIRNGSSIQIGSVRLQLQTS